MKNKITTTEPKLMIQAMACQMGVSLGFITRALRRKTLIQDGVPQNTERHERRHEEQVLFVSSRFEIHVRLAAGHNPEHNRNGVQNEGEDDEVGHFKGSSEILPHTET